tara:strand:- start:23 stop:313 length:291 start_codon:yes stop_codon:yes gene_type:complete
MGKELKKISNPKTDWIDDFFDEIDDPIIDSCTLIGYIETLILNTIYDLKTQNDLIDQIAKLKESEVSSFIYNLKLNQIIRDPKHQYDMMVRAGVFN